MLFLNQLEAVKILNMQVEVGGCYLFESEKKNIEIVLICYRLLLKYYKEHQKGEGTQRVTEKQILTLTLECLCCIVTIVTQQFTSELDKFLSSIGNL
jgi:hypothetical protein